MEFYGVMSGQLKPSECKDLGKAPVKRVQHEATEQIELFHWARLSEGKHPELVTMFAVPNGGTRRDAVEGARLKAAGVRAGQPDLCLPAPSKDGRYNCLFIELKRRDGGTVSKAQEDRMALLNRFGSYAVVCHGWEAAAEEIEGYLGGRR